MVASTGFRILKRRRAVADEWLDKFRLLPVANVSDCMNRLTGLGADIRPRHRAGRMCGRALTVRSRPGDNRMAHAALAMLQPGDVLVIDCGGDLTNATAGELMMIAAQRRGAAGFVINGAIRDLDWVQNNDLPVFSAGVTHRGPYKHGPGEINVAIAIGGDVIEPGDLIIGDADGVLRVSQDEVAEIYPLAQAMHQKELQLLDGLGHDDQTALRKQLFNELAALGCTIDPDAY